MPGRKSCGTIYRRDDGKWVVKQTRNGRTIKRIASTKKEAKAKLAAISHELEREDRMINRAQGFGVDPRTVSTGEVFDAFLREKKSGRTAISASSYQRLSSTIHIHILPEFRMVPFIELRSRDINDLLDKKIEEGFSYSTIKKVYDAFSACCNYAVDVLKLMLPADSPLAGVRMFSKSRFETSEINYYSPEERRKIEAEALRRNTKGTLVYRYGPVFVLLLNTGLRAGEICALAQSDVDQNRELLHVTKTAITVKDETGHWKTMIESHPKTEKSNRYVPLNDKSRDMICILEEEVSQNPTLVVSTTTGGITPPTALNKSLDRILHASGVQKKGGVHALRDTFATALFNNGTDIFTVSALLGHASSKVTEQHYVKVLDQRKMRAVQIMEI